MNDRAVALTDPPNGYGEWLTNLRKLIYSAQQRTALALNAKMLCVCHSTEFLLELGTGFALVGRQMHLEFGGDDSYIDLLFYHLRLRKYVVIELKAEKFEPEHLGQPGFYMSAVDDLLRHVVDGRQSACCCVRRETKQSLNTHSGTTPSPSASPGISFWSSA